jgi:TPR repeat protein
MYDSGISIDKNPREAVYWYRRAADQGYAPAQNNLGVLYDQGVGVPKDPEQAMRWYRLAAEQGDGSACTNLAYTYAGDTGAKPDLTSAYFWALLALRNPSVLTTPLSSEFAATLRNQISSAEATRIEAQVEEWMQKHHAAPGTTPQDWFNPVPADPQSRTSN